MASQTIELLKQRFDTLLSRISSRLDDKLDKTGVATSARRLSEPMTITLSGNASGGASFDGSDDVVMTITVTSTATLTNARLIGGVAFNGSSDIDLPGVNTTGNQDTTGNAASATRLINARLIGGVGFDGSGNINLPGVNVIGNQNTTGRADTAVKLANARNITVGNATRSFDGSANIVFNHADIGVVPLAAVRTVGAFYPGTDAPNSTDRTNYNGVIYAYRLFSVDDGGGSTSDRRLKTDITPIDDPIERAIIVGKNAFTHAWTKDALAMMNVEQDRKIALDAQTVQHVYPEAVDVAPFDRDKDGGSKSGEFYLAVKYERTIPGLFAAFSAFVEETRSEIDSLKIENENLRHLLRALLNQKS